MGTAAAAEEAEVDALSLVTGDILLLTIGQKVPADIPIVSVLTSIFAADEASLTRERDNVAETSYWGDAASAIDDSQKAREDPFECTPQGCCTGAR